MKRDEFAALEVVLPNQPENYIGKTYPGICKDKSLQSPKGEPLAE